MSGITVTGEVRRVEHKMGSFKNDAGENIAYDYIAVRILAGDEMVEVKFPRDSDTLPIPAKGAHVSVEVELPGRIKPKAVGYVQDGKRAA